MKTIIFDSEVAIRCSSCKKLIGAGEPKTLIGYKELLIVMHPACWKSEAIRRQSRPSVLSPSNGAARRTPDDQREIRE